MKRAVILSTLIGILGLGLMGCESKEQKKHKAEVEATKKEIGKRNHEFFEMQKKQNEENAKINKKIEELGGGGNKQLLEDIKKNDKK